MIIHFPSPVKTVLTRLQDAGFEAFAVGGAVRDALLGRPVHDWDLTTSATPEEVRRVFSDLPVLKTGIKHGTVTVLIGEMPIEITTFRTESGYSDKRHPDSVAFSSSVEDDLCRRDFTINAIAYNESRGPVDPFGGAKDLRHRIIRCVGDPNRRFSEDALRILRAARFSSVFGFSIDADTLSAANRLAPTLRDISAERLLAELKKLLCGENVREVLEVCRGILFAVIPELKPCDGFLQHNPHHLYDVYGHIVRSVEAIAPDPVLRLTMLLHDIEKPACFSADADGVGHFYGHEKKSAQTAGNILRRLKCDNRTREDVVFLIEKHMILLDPEPKLMLRRLNQYGERRLKMLMAVRRADAIACGTHGDELPQIDACEALVERLCSERRCFSLKDLAVNGHDLTAKGFSGEEVGRALRLLLQKVMDGTAENSRTALLAVIDTLTHESLSECEK